MILCIFIWIVNCVHGISSLDPPTWDTAPSDLSLSLGSSVKLNCSAHGANEPTIIWSRIRSSPDGEIAYEIGKGSPYTIDPVKLDDAGAYKCEAIDPKTQKAIAQRFTLKVYAGPRFTPEPNRVNSIRGHSATLSCEAFGARPMNGSWYRLRSGEQEVIDGTSSSLRPSRFSIVESSFGDDDNRTLFELHIDKVELGDSGSYRCKAMNEFGQDEKTNYLTVQDVPSSPLVFAIDGVWTRTVSVHWSPASPNGSPIKHYILQYWQVNVTTSSKLYEEQVSALQLTHQIQDQLKPGTTYSIRLIAENSLGRSLPSETLAFTTKEEEPDGPPIGVRVESKTTRTLNVIWKAPLVTHWRGQLKGYHLAYKETPQVESSGNIDPNTYTSVYPKFEGDFSDDYKQKITIVGLEPSKGYTLIVRAYNAAGYGPFSAPIYSETSAVDPPKPPVIRISEKREYVLTIGIDDPSSDIINYYTLYYREENGPWLQRSFPVSKSNEYEIDGLKSSTWYQIYMVSSSDYGASEPSKVVSIKTSTESYDQAPDQHEYNYDSDLRNAQYYGSFIVIPIAVTIIIVVIIIVCAYVFVYMEEKKTDLFRSNYMTHTPATNFQYIGTVPASATTMNHQIMTTENSVLSLPRYVNDKMDRVQPLIPRTLMPTSAADTMKCYYHKRPMLSEAATNQEYATPYEARIFRERSSSLPPDPQMHGNHHLIGTINSSRTIPSQHIYMNGSLSSLASQNDLTRPEDRPKDNDHRYDYFNFL